MCVCRAVETLHPDDVIGNIKTRKGLRQVRTYWAVYLSAAFVHDCLPPSVSPAPSWLLSLPAKRIVPFYIDFSSSSSSFLSC